MIRRLVDFSLDNRFLVLAAALLLLVWGAISFHQLPVEAYPDVANNYVDIITQWPGISAEQLSGANDMLASSHRFAHALIAVEAGIPDSGASRPQPQFKEFAEAAEKTLELLSAIFRGKRAAEREFPDLREIYSRMTHSSGAEDTRYAFVTAEADRMVNSLNTLREQVLARKRGVRGEG